MDIREFEKLVAASQDAAIREIVQENPSVIRIKKEARAVENLRRISEATLEIANRQGFQAMSMRDLSAATGLSLGAMYAYFSSKEELLALIQEYGRRTVARVLGERMLAVPDARTRLRTLIYAHIFLSEIMHAWFYFSYMEAKNLGKKDQKAAIESELFTEGLFAGILEEGSRAGAFADHDTIMTASLIKSILQDWYLKRWKYRTRKVSAEDYAAFVTGFVESYLDRRG
ncbi:MAG: TetR/AcrR family transcriptional regulator [Spirochaetes bacterium]|nr:MAG: TetR/AcrR family transcriptional regulator [Spirochaetota bacterium]